MGAGCRREDTAEEARPKTYGEITAGFGEFHAGKANDFNACQNLRRIIGKFAAELDGEFLTAYKLKRRPNQGRRFETLSGASPEKGQVFSAFHRTRDNSTLRLIANPPMLEMASGDLFLGAPDHPVYAARRNSGSNGSEFMPTKTPKKRKPRRPPANDFKSVAAALDAMRTGGGLRANWVRLRAQKLDRRRGAPDD